MDSTLFSLFIICCAAILCAIQIWELIRERRKDRKAAKAQREWERQFDAEWQGLLRAVDGSQAHTTKDHRPLH